MQTSSQRKRWTLFAVALIALAASLVVLGSRGVVKAQDAGSRPSVLYVESNISTTNGNTVLGFSNDGAGNLTPVPGSPYLTNGARVVRNGNGTRPTRTGS